MGKEHRRGFASMDRRISMQIWSKAGKASHQKRKGKKIGHEWTPKEARAAARKSLRARGYKPHARRSLKAQTKRVGK
jgi:hypothetical protein